MKEHIHFSGIAGSAMAQLAILLQKTGYTITGSDANIYPPVSTLLENNQIDISIGYRKENLLSHPDIVVIGNALSRGNPEVEYCLQQRLFYTSMAELLKEKLIRGNCPIVITGTHGKTTTTSLTAHIISQTKENYGFFIGGKANNFPVSAHACREKGGYFVIEGDEYDTAFFDKRAKFFHYLPELLVINNLEFDHADIYDSIEDIKKAFTLMLRQMPQTGKVFVNGDDKNALEIASHSFCPVVRFGTNTECEAYIHNITSQINPFITKWKLDYKGQTYSLAVPLLGEINVRNATAAVLNALEINIDITDIQTALLSFLGVARRMNSLQTQAPLLIFDDFAHHPTAIQASIQALKQVHPNARLHVAFEPRSNTCIRKDHQNQLPTAFKGADFVYLYKLYRPERITPENRLNREQVKQDIENITCKKTAFLSSSLLEITSQIQKNIQENDIILCLSQGDFDGLPSHLASNLKI